MYDEKFGTIKGVSEKRRLPLLGKIRLGLKKKSEKTGKEYPTETDYFVCPPEVQKHYGEKPKSLDIMFPVAKRHIIFPQAYRWYGSSRGLKCIGNGEIARRFSEDKKGMEEIECSCENLEKGICKKRAFLMAILPKVNMGGVYQISTGAINSIIDINSGLDFIEALIGRVQMIPLTLSRRPMETHNEGKKQTHYTLNVNFDGNIDFINRLRENTKRVLLEADKIALPAPQDENPEFDPVDVIEKNGISDEENETPINDVSSDSLAIDDVITQVQIEELRELYKKNKLTKKDLDYLLQAEFGKEKIESLTHNEASDLIKRLKDNF